MTLLVDTSASRALGFARYVRSVRELVAKLRAKYGDDAAARGHRVRSGHEAIYSGAARGYGDAQDKALVERGAAGASDLGQALAAISAARRADAARASS